MLRFTLDSGSDFEYRLGVRPDLRGLSTRAEPQGGTSQRRDHHSRGGGESAICPIDVCQARSDKGAMGWELQAKRKEVEDRYVLIRD